MGYLLLAINEEFLSYQGEGEMAGTRMYFVRTQGCDVGCHFCDTKFTWKPEDQTVSEKSIVKRARASGAEWVCITGGEPLLQNLVNLIDKLYKANLFVMIETSGVEWSDLVKRFHFVCCSPKDLFTTKDYKLDEHFLTYANEMKCVVTKDSDIDFYLKLLEGYGGIKTFQPVDNNPAIVKIIANRNLPDWHCRIQQQKFMEVR